MPNVVPSRAPTPNTRSVSASCPCSISRKIAADVIGLLTLAMRKRVAAVTISRVIGLATAFVTYRERGILRRIQVTPFPLTSFILARVISQLLVAGLQAVILIGMAWAFFGLHLRGNPLVLLVVIAAGAMAFLAIGFAISGIAPNTETAASYANLVTFPMLFLSGIFFSMENAPAWLRPITKILPLSYLVDALREPMSFGNGLSAIWLDLLALILTFIIAMAISVRFFRWDSRPA